ncbi:diacylglycerol kinase [Thiomicrorhabdus lithotrophica]|uniref:Diacylglycerol kinase n=1 Tax=Thiomicrorhabdus lithotrophica TaxID=2949997 RepID=A0ABY8CA74_9GAMM|nr:diacylglycerol kinase [Thiomicrorhabdus lithotrophica]WEJ62132.1 diacylglycerol kinase [Thiomicrorhabdus lithotrophica]
MKSPHSGLKRVIHAAGYSWKGFKSTWKHEAAFRQEIVLFSLMSPFVFWLGDTAAERVILIAVLLIVLVVEILNSAVESIVDRIGEGYHELSGRAKDQGSAAVFLSFFMAILVWGGFLISKLVG